MGLGLLQVGTPFAKEVFSRFAFNRLNLRL